MAAVTAGDPRRAAVLLDHHAFTEDRDDLGRTPLLVATAEGQVEIVRLLLAHGADPNALTKPAARLCSWRIGLNSLKLRSCSRTRARAEVPARLAPRRAANFPGVNGLLAHPLYWGTDLKVTHEPAARRMARKSGARLRPGRSAILASIADSLRDAL